MPESRAFTSTGSSLERENLYFFKKCLTTNYDLVHKALTLVFVQTNLAEALYF